MIDIDRTDRRITRHGMVRCQQRSISWFLRDLVIDFGRERSAGNGATSHSFDKESWHRAAKYLGREARYFERARDVYVIVASDGGIITSAWRH